MQTDIQKTRFGGTRLLVTSALALLLAAGIGFQLLYRLREVPQSVGQASLAERVAKEIPGWTVSDEALAQTEGGNEAVLKMLNLDDYVYRRFRKGAVSFTVYAAHWAAGRMPTRLVASHTPDRCWTENGMRCVAMQFRERYSANGQPLLPAEYRVFTPATTQDKTFVVYWHAVEGKSYDYGSRFNAIPSPWLWWKDTIAQAAYGSREQVFVRIASDRPIAELWNDPDFQKVMRTVGDLGLWDKS